jgi:hypothetical protein
MMGNRLLKEVDYESAGRPFESGWARQLNQWREDSLRLARRVKMLRVPSVEKSSTSKISFSMPGRESVFTPRTISRIVFFSLNTGVTMEWILMAL